MDAHRTPDEMSSDWKAALAESTGNWAFVLTISRRMVFTLQCVRDGIGAKYFYEGAPTILGPRSGHWIPSMSSVMKRGLVDHVGPDGNRRYVLTPAGECVVRLLEYAGLMQPKVKPVEQPAPVVKLRRKRA